MSLYESIEKSKEFYVYNSFISWLQADFITSKLSTQHGECFGVFMPNQKEPIVKYLKVKSHMNRMIRLAREKHIIQISLDDIRQIKETLKYTNLANLPQDYFKAVESVLGKDVKRKRELYAAKYNIDWRFHLDPRDELKKLKKETPITERIKKLLTAEARAEYALPNQELRDKWVNQKIDYEKFIKLNLELFNSIYESITIEENCWQ